MKWRPDPRDRVRVGLVYLLHFERKYRHAGHYLGFTECDPDARTARHLAGRGARLMAVIAAAGIPFRLVRLWRGTRADERRLKNGGGVSPHLCPICAARPRVVGYLEELERPRVELRL